MTRPSPASPEHQDGSIETLLVGRGAGTIFYIRETDQFMFFLRDEKDWIPYPGMVDILGGRMEDDDADPLAAAMRELEEELDDLDTGKPFQPDGVFPFRQWVDGRNVEQNIFGCVLERLPNLRLNEGQHLVFLGRDELATTEFAFNYSDVVCEFAEWTTTA